MADNTLNKLNTYNQDSRYFQINKIYTDYWPYY